MIASTKGRYALRVMADMAEYCKDGEFISLKDIAAREEISEKYLDYADSVYQTLKNERLNVSLDDRSEKIGYKIREARLQHVPYLLIVGAKEEEEKKVSLRSRYKGDEGMVDLADFIKDIKEEIANKTIRKVEVEEQK